MPGHLEMPLLDVLKLRKKSFSLWWKFSLDFLGYIFTLFDPWKLVIFEVKVYLYYVFKWRRIKFFSYYEILLSADYTRIYPFHFWYRWFLSCLFSFVSLHCFLMSSFLDLCFWCYHHFYWFICCLHIFKFLVFGCFLLFNFPPFWFIIFSLFFFFSLG